MGWIAAAGPKKAQKDSAATFIAYSIPQLTNLVNGGRQKNSGKKAVTVPVGRVAEKVKLLETFAAKSAPQEAGGRRVSPRTLSPDGP